MVDAAPPVGPATGNSAAGNLARFSGFADVYDAHRPTPPQALGPRLLEYATGTGHHGRAHVVDLGSGTGLATRWAAGWAASVVGVEPNDDMRAAAARHETAHVTYRAGASHATGLDDEIADIVLAVQAMHWMEPEPTLAEVARLLRPGGVFAVVDADWPPVTGAVAIEEAWTALHARIRVFDARVARGETGTALRAPIADDDIALADDDLRDPHRNRAMPDDVRSWSKGGHLDRMVASRRFAYARELLFDQPTDGGGERVVALMRSQGSYQALRRHGLDDEVLGVDDFARAVHRAYDASPPPAGLSFAWRARIGITPRP